ncbi:hypothetical protein NQ317_005546 [Molorchus minor]|uniref:Uncharacterized protein n=1 Tax=Molorchus minor TaxID=1323400 RepID=A0ABQ9JX70_9CUCU|nr:hypothetical protein NQ317_005546 [Molorchus minor]
MVFISRIVLLTKLNILPYTIDHVQILTPEQTMVESPEPIMQSPQPILHKKGRRGRPRKYPIVPPPLVKRPRGRPRLNPFVPQDSPKPQNFDLTNTPDLPSTSYADVDYVTKSNEIGEQLLGDQGIMEPLVEIKTESVEQHHEEKVQETQTTSTFLENIGLLENTAIAKIGECTISVANNGNNSIAPNPVFVLILDFPCFPSVLTSGKSAQEDFLLSFSSISSRNALYLAFLESLTS